MGYLPVENFSIDDLSRRSPPRPEPKSPQIHLYPVSVLISSAHQCGEVVPGCIDSSRVIVERRMKSPVAGSQRSKSGFCTKNIRVFDKESKGVGSAHEGVFIRTRVGDVFG